MDRHYIQTLLTVALGGLITVGAVNWLVDPYGVFNTLRVEGFNALKPEVSRRQRLSKAYEVFQIKPEAVILGTSRALNLDPSHPHWRRFRAYNLALSSSSIYEQFRYLQQAVAAGSIRQAVIGLDFFAFNERFNSDFRESRLVSGTMQEHQPFDSGDIFPALLSADAFRSSLKTIRKQADTSGIIPDKAQRVRQKGGHRAMFQELEDGMLAQWGFDPESRLFSGIGTINEPGSFRKLLRLAHAQNIGLDLFVSPSHARVWETWRLASAWPAIESWKRAVVQALEEEARLAGAKPYPLWDFSGYNTVTKEPVPLPGDTQATMRWYWEGSHYSLEAGNLILDRIFGHQDPDRRVPEDFGVLLNASNLDRHLSAIREQSAHYRQTFVDDIAELETALERQRRQRTSQPSPQSVAQHP